MAIGPRCIRIQLPWLLLQVLTTIIATNIINYLLFNILKKRKKKKKKLRFQKRKKKNLEVKSCNCI